MTKKISNILLLAILFAATPVSGGLFQNSDPALDSFETPSIRYDEKLATAADLATSWATRYSRRRCWRAVKNALLAADVVESRPVTVFAKDAGRELEQNFDFKKIEMTNPFNAPVGAVLVYGGKGPGHVEIRTAKGFVSDFTSKKPSPRPLLGIYVKSEVI